MIDVLITEYLKVLEDLAAASLKVESSSTSLSNIRELQEKILLSEICEIPSEKCLAPAMILKTVIDKLRANVSIVSNIFFCTVHYLN